MLSGEPSGLSGGPLGSSGEPFGLSGEPLGLSGQPLGLSGEPLGLSGEPWKGGGGGGLSTANLPGLGYYNITRDWARRLPLGDHAGLWSAASAAQQSLPRSRWRSTAPTYPQKERGGGRV